MMSKNNVLKLLPIGGLGEIGMNCMSYEWQDELFLLDCGVLFPDASSPGITAFAPDFSYLKQNAHKFKALIITHGHEDHIGAVAYLARKFSLDVYATAFPLGLMKRKLQERNDIKTVRLKEIKIGKKFKVGSFIFDPIQVAHSFVDSLAFAIETPVGTIIHSGDYKHDTFPYQGKRIDFTLFEKYREKKGVKLLLADSTNAEQKGHSKSEEDILPAFDTLFQEQKNRIFIAMFSSNIQRVGNLFELAHNHRKKVALVGRSLHNYVSLASELGLLDIPKGLLINVRDTDDYADKNVLVFTTGTQAEPGSGLTRMIDGSHRDIRIRPGDVVAMSSRIIPGNEKAITKMINSLHRLGAEVKYQRHENLHVSGHGYQDELKMLIRACQPEHFLPVHGEYRMMRRHAMMANEEGVSSTHVVENGQSLHLTVDSFTLGEKYDFGLTPIVNGVVLEADDYAMERRHAISRAGIVHVTVVRDRHNLKLLTLPRFSVEGILYRDDVDPTQVIVDAASHINEVCNRFRETPDLEEKIRLETRRFFQKRTSFKPIVVPELIHL